MPIGCVFSQVGKKHCKMSEIILKKDFEKMLQEIRETREIRTN